MTATATPPAALALAATASSVTVTPRNSVLYATISPKLHSNQ